MNELRAGEIRFFAGADTQKSVAEIVRLIRESRKIPDVRLTAENIVAGVSERDWRSEMKVLWEWVRGNMRYTQDTDGVELVKTPLRHITDIRERGATYGDCDDATVLLGALLVNAGYTVKVVIVKSEWNTGDAFNHIYLYAQIPHTNAWIVLDATAKNKPFGYEAKYRERKVYEV